MARRHAPLFYAVPLLLLFSLATRTEAVARLQVNTTASASVSNFNQQVSQALAKLVRTNGTHANVVVKPPFAFNASIRADTLKMAGQLMQQMIQAQPLLAMLQQKNSTAGRALLADESTGIDIADISSVQTMAATTTSTTTTKTTNNRKIAARINLVMSDAWLVAYSGFKVAQVSFQLLAAMLKAGATGTVTVDTALILLFSDVATNFASTVSYLLYGIQKLSADAVAPLCLVKVSPAP
jgi:hypothetical protein